jgi:hypothetical protein
MCSATGHVRFTPESDRKSGFPQTVMSALPPKTDMCGALAHVCYGPKADVDHSIISPGNSDPTHGRVIHSVDCLPRLRMMSVFIILKLTSPFA